MGVSPICKAQERRPLWHGRKTQKRRSGLLGALVLLILLGVMAYKLVEVYGDLSAAKEQEHGSALRWSRRRRRTTP